MENFQIKIVPSKILKQKCEPVKKEDFGKALDAKMSGMLKIMLSNNGVGLAGPQVGDPRRIIVAHASDVDINYLKMVNPRVIERSETMVSTEEGCLSVPGYFIKVPRADTLKVEYNTPMGEVWQATFEGLAAIVIQHELDHLDGITLLDKSSRLKRTRYLQKRAKLNKKISRAIKKMSNI